ncbi:MAG: alpha,alpha-trehalose-phosphate synthase (UDP-forming) [Candidatus Dormibacteraceae bacterium]
MALRTPAQRMIGQEAARLLGTFSPVVVSNRAPVEPLPDGTLRSGAGGLVTALTSLAEATRAPWVAVARTPVERTYAASGNPIEAGADPARTFPVFFAPTTTQGYHLHYAVISNPLLWSAHHFLWNIAMEPVVDKEIHRAWSKGYVPVNAAIAERAVEVALAMPGVPLFLTQDYQLYLAPAMIRKAIPEAVMQHFIHVPWPPPRYLKVLPASMREPIFDGLLANDIVGLQTSVDVHNFLACCAELMGLRVDADDGVVFSRGRLVWVRSYPISTDVDAMRELGESPAVHKIEAEIEKWRPEKLIVRVDRTDPSKNLIRGFLAFERLLGDHHEQHGRVVFWAFLQPSRQDITMYRDYLRQVQATVERINRRFRTAAWEPTRLELGEDADRMAAAYRSYDVLLVNPILDGMNLVAKEGLVVNQRSGVLVLSESAGAHEELGMHALSINAFDVEMTARALYAALEMSEAERDARSQTMRQIVASNDIARWVRLQLQDIRSLRPAISARVES